MSQQNQKNERNSECACPYTSCPRHGDCEKCQAYHHSHGSKTSCGK
jgi:hypothetical protein